MSLLGLTHQEVDELLDKCPLACGECKELMPNTPKPTKDPTTKPTPSPTVNPTRNPTLKPTKHQSNCSDDSKYISKLGVACADHAGINCNAMLLLGFTEAEMKDLFSKCPRSCGKCPHFDGNDSITVTKPTQPKKNVNKQISTDQTVTTYPTRSPESSCSDESSYSDGFGSVCSDFSGLDCAMMGLLGYSETDVKRLIRECRESCGYCVETISPSINSSYSPSLQRTAKPITGTPTIVPTSVQPTKWPTYFPTYGPTESSYLENILETNLATITAPQEMNKYAPTLAPSHKKSPDQKEEKSSLARKTYVPTLPSPKEKLKTSSPTKQVKETIIISVSPMEITLSPYNESLTDEELNSFVSSSDKLTQDCVTSLNPNVSVIFFTSVEWQVTNDDTVTLKLKKKAVVSTSDTRWLNENEKLLEITLHSCLNQEPVKKQLIEELHSASDNFMNINLISIRSEAEKRGAAPIMPNPNPGGFGLVQILGATIGGIVAILAFSLYIIHSKNKTQKGSKKKKFPSTTPRNGGQTPKGKKQIPLSAKNKKSRPTPIQRRSDPVTPATRTNKAAKVRKVHFPDSATSRNSRQTFMESQNTAEESSSGEFDEVSKSVASIQAEEPKSRFLKGQKVMYDRHNEPVIILKIEKDDLKKKTYYTILFGDGKEKKTTVEHISKLTIGKVKKQKNLHTQKNNTQLQKQPKQKKENNLIKKRNQKQASQNAQTNTREPQKQQKRVRWGEEIDSSRAQSPGISASQSSINSGPEISQDSQDEFETSIATTPVSVFSQSSVSVFSEASTTDDSETGFFVTSQSLSEESPDLY